MEDGNTDRKSAPKKRKIKDFCFVSFELHQPGLAKPIPLISTAHAIAAAEGGNTSSDEETVANFSKTVDSSEDVNSETGDDTIDDCPETSQNMQSQELAAEEEADSSLSPKPTSSLSHGQEVADVAAMLDANLNHDLLAFTAAARPEIVLKPQESPSTSELLSTSGRPMRSKSKRCPNLLIGKRYAKLVWNFF